MTTKTLLHKRSENDIKVEKDLSDQVMTEFCYRTVIAKLIYSQSRIYAGWIFDQILNFILFFINWWYYTNNEAKIYDTLI